MNIVKNFMLTGRLKTITYIVLALGTITIPACSKALEFSEANRKICHKNMLGSETVGICVCKVSTLRDELSDRVFEKFSDIVFRDDPNELTSFMIMLAVEQPEEIQRIQFTQKTKCK